MNKELLLYFALLLWFVVPLQAQPTILASHYTADENDIVEVDIMAREFDQVIGLQFAVDWDETILEFVSVENFSLPFAGSSNYNISASGKLRVNWFGDAYTAAENVPLFTIRLKAIGVADESSEVIFTDDTNAGGTPFVIEIIDSNSNFVDVQFENGSVTINGPMTSASVPLPQLALLQNTPNPFHTFTQILFQLNTADVLSLSVYNTQGKEVFTRTAKYSVGQHRIVIENDDLPTTGLYVYRLRSEKSGEFSKIMFFNK